MLRVAIWEHKHGREVRAFASGGDAKKWCQETAAIIEACGPNATLDGANRTYRVPVESRAAGSVATRILFALPNNGHLASDELPEAQAPRGPLCIIGAPI